MIGHPLIILGTDRTAFTVGVGETFVVPDSVPAPSPTSAYVPSGVAGTFQNTRPAVGGQLFVTVSDAAGPNNVIAFENEFYPGDTIALSAVSGGVVTITYTPVNGTAATIGKITGVTTKAWLLGWYA